jgi:zinc protease
VQAAPVVHQHRLDNGLEVIVIESRLTPLASIGLAVRHGVRDEGPAETGLAHLFEHMLLRPNQVLTTDAELTARKLDLGVGIFGGTDEEVVRVGVTVPKGNVREALQFVRDMVVSPRFDATALATEKRVMENEDSHRGWTDARMVAIDRLLWWKYPTRKWDIGEGQNLPSLTVADLQRTQRRYYVPDNAALVVVGDVEAAQLFRDAEETFSVWRASRHGDAQVGPPGPAVVHPPLQGNQVVVAPLDWPAVAGSMFWHGPSSPGGDAALAHAAQLLAAAFRLGYGARQQLAQRCGQFDFDWSPSSNVGVLQLKWQSVPESADSCVLGVLEELPRVARSLTDDDLKEARKLVTGDMLREREKPEVLLRDVARAWAAGDVAECFDLEARLAAVTRADVARLVDRFISDQPYVLSVWLPKALIDKGMDVAHFKSLTAIRRVNRERH